MNFQRACVGVWTAAVAVSVLAAPSTSFGQAVQWKVSDGGNGHWYQGVSFPPLSAVPWLAARASAVEAGGDLASLTTPAEADWVYASLVSNNALWQGDFGPYVGLYQVPNSQEPSDGWFWVDGTPNGGAVAWYWNQPDNFAASCGGDQYASYWTGGPWFPSPRDFIGDVSGTGFCCCEKGGERIPSALIEWSADCNSDGIVDYGQCRDGSLPDYNLNNIPDCCEAGVPCVVGNYPVQWRVEDGGNGHWYQFVISGPVAWHAAKSSAELRGGYLACVASASENEFITSVVASPAGWTPVGSGLVGPWLGGFQPVGSPEPTGGWSWVSGEPWTFQNWTYPEPNDGWGCGGCENWLHLLTQPPHSGITGYWNDAPLNDGFVKSFIVEWSADCNSDGIVDYGQILSGVLVDADDNGVPDVCEIDPCPGDVNSSGVVNGTDIAIILGAWGTSGGKFPRSDANGDGVVDAADLAIVLGGWGPCP